MLSIGFSLTREDRFNSSNNSDGHVASYTSIDTHVEGTPACSGQSTSSAQSPRHCHTFENSHKMDGIEIEKVISLRKMRASALHSRVREDKKTKRFLAVGTFLAGMSKLHVLKKLRVRRSTITFWLKRCQDSGDVEEQKRRGRPRATSHEADRQLIRLCESDRLLFDVAHSLERVSVKGYTKA